MCHRPRASFLTESGRRKASKVPAALCELEWQLSVARVETKVGKDTFTRDMSEVVTSDGHGYKSEGAPCKWLPGGIWIALEER